MIPSFNCAGYLAETLESVLSQDPGEAVMQIEVVDDHSTADDPESVVDEYGGRVGFYRQPRNVGHVRNFNTCLERARGHLVHLLHGDDAVRPGFYATMERPFIAYSEIGAACCRHVYVDSDGTEASISRLHRGESGTLEDAAFRIVAGLAIQPPAMVVRRETYDRVGGFDTRLSVAGEDIEMWVRIASRFPIWYETEPLALYHRRPSSLVGGSMRSGAAIRDARVALELAAANLADDRKPAALAHGRRRIADWAIRQAQELAAIGDGAGAKSQLYEALRTDRSAATMAKMARTLPSVVHAFVRNRPTSARDGRS
jgi:hypothetical protein